MTHHTTEVVLADGIVGRDIPFPLRKRAGKVRPVELADTITVLRDGELVASQPASSLDRNGIIRLMVGRELSGEIYADTTETRKIRPLGRKILSVENLSMGGLVRNSSFSVYEGQVTGMFGLVGSGRTEMMKVVAGVIKRDFFHGGQVRLFGRPIRYRVPAPAIRDGIVYLCRENGVLMALDARTGKKHYQERTVKDRHRASPIWANGSTIT